MGEERALRDLCKLISPSPGVPEDPAWEYIAKVANRHFLAPALFAALKDLDLLGGVPKEFSGYLREIHTLNRLRNEAVLGELARASQALNLASIVPVALKGGAALLEGIPPDPGARFMVDLDLWGPAQIEHAAAQALLDAGYTQPLREDTRPGDSHGAFFQRDDSPVKIEWHRRFLHLGHGALNAVLEEELADRRRVRLPAGCEVDLPSPLFEVLHSAVHYQVSHSGFRLLRLDLRQLYNFSHLLSAHRERIDWDRFWDVVRRADCLSEIEGLFALEEYLFGTNVTQTYRSKKAVRWAGRVLSSHRRQKHLRFSGRIIRNLALAFSRQTLLRNGPADVGTMRLFLMRFAAAARLGRKLLSPLNVGNSLGHIWNEVAR